MNTKDECDQIAIEHAGICAGAYLDEIGKTDLEILTVEEWDTFTEVMCLRFAEKRAVLQPSII